MRPQRRILVVDGRPDRVSVASLAPWILINLGGNARDEHPTPASQGRGRSSISFWAWMATV